MPLLPDLVGLAQPAKDLLVHLFPRSKAERVDMIAGRNMLHFREPGILQMTCKHNVSDKPVTPQAHSRKAHPHLEGDASLLRHHQNRTALANQLRKFPKQRNRHLTFPCKVLAQRIARASM